jgi:hypothetical protein|tara:strand:+ start:2919 stop:3128 length:210 start_codon:yes stop_codon:yes gene_type:complete
MQEITYELTCDDCGNDYTIINLLRDHHVEDNPAYCPFCGTGVDFNFGDDEHDEMDSIIEELDDLDFDDN